MTKINPTPFHDAPTRAVISVIEMAEMLSLSKSRFYSLMESGIFPRPIQNESCKRPVFNLELQQKCLEIRQTGIGHNGRPVLFNRVRKNGKLSKQRPPKPQPPQEDHTGVAEALKSLGLVATSEAVGRALAELYPNGWREIDQGDLVRQVFLHLQTKR